MATINYLLSSSRAGLGSVIVDAAGHNANLISNVGVTSYLIAPGAAAMNGIASVAVTGIARVSGVAAMDGRANVLMASAFLILGDANMDGVASVLATSVTLFGGAAHMDGQAQVQAASTTYAAGAANMDGRASEVVLQSVAGAGLAEMDGEASMIVYTPNKFNLNLQEFIFSSEATAIRASYNRSMSQGIVSGEITKPKLHYKYTFHDNINLTSTISYRSKYVKTLRDTAITVTPSLAARSQLHYDLTIPIGVGSALTPEWFAVVSLVQSLLVDQTTSDKFIWGRVLAQALKVSASLDAHALYKAALTQLFKIIEFEGFKLRHPVVLNQDIDLFPSLIGALALKLLQKFKITTTALPGFSYHLSLAGNVVLRDTLEHLVDAVLEQLFTVHDAPDRQYIAKNTLAQVLTIHPALTNKLVLKLVGHIQVSPEQLVSMIYRGDPLLDGVAITALYVSPSGVTTTWVVNTRTQAVTEYLNYDFRSFAQMGDRYIAAGPEGLYELDGDTDAGALIVSRLMSGYLQLNEKKLFGIKGAYVAIRGGGRFYLRLIAGDGREYVYELKAQPNLMTTKVRVGKGIKTAYMAYELVTEGQDFDLDSIEFIPMTSGRRV